MILGKNSTWRPQLNSPPFDPKIGVSSSHRAALLISGFPAKPTLVAAPEAEVQIFRWRQRSNTNFFGFWFYLQTFGLCVKYKLLRYFGFVLIQVRMADSWFKSEIGQSSPRTETQSHIFSKVNFLYSVSAPSRISVRENFKGKTS